MKMDTNMMILIGGIVLVAIAAGLKMYKPKKADGKTVDDEKAKKFSKIAYALLAAGLVAAGFGGYKKYGHLLKKQSSIASDLASPSFDF